MAHDTRTGAGLHARAHAHARKDRATGGERRGDPCRRGGCYMIRETISGAVTEYSKFYVPEGTRPRSSRRGKSSPRKQDQNDRDAAKRWPAS